MKNKAPYFPFYVDDWLDNDDVFSMGLECEGAYIRLLAALWKRGGTLPDNPRLICNLLRIKPAKWKKIRAALVDEFGVISYENGTFFNQRLIEELKVFSEKSEKSSRSASKRWDKNDKTGTEKPNKINETEHANALPTQCHIDIDKDIDNKTYTSDSPPSESPQADVSVLPVVQKCPHDKIIDLYHEILPELPCVSKSRWMGTARAKNLQARWKENPAHQSLEFWKQFFQLVRENDFWMGKSASQWKANLEWLVKRANFDKVYDMAERLSRRASA